MLRFGESYLIIEPSFDRGVSLFSKFITAKKNGLIVWRIHPQKMPVQFKNELITTKWITNINTVEEHLSPHELEQISYDIEQFMNQNKGSVVLLSCVDYLLSFNSFNEILHFVQATKDFASEYNCLLIICVGEGTLEKQQENLLKQELILVGEKDE